MDLGFSFFIEVLMSQVYVYRNHQVVIVRRFADCVMVRSADNEKAELLPIAIAEGKEMPDGLVLAHPGIIATSAKVDPLKQRVVNFAPDPERPNMSKMTDSILTNPPDARTPVLNEVHGYADRPELDNIILDTQADVVNTNMEQEPALPPFDINTATVDTILSTFKGVSRIACTKVVERRPPIGYNSVEELIALNKDVRVNWVAIKDQLAFSSLAVS